MHLCNIELKLEGIDKKFVNNIIVSLSCTIFLSLYNANYILNLGKFTRKQKCYFSK